MRARAIGPAAGSALPAAAATSQGRPAAARACGGCYVRLHSAAWPRLAAGTCPLFAVTAAAALVAAAVLRFSTRPRAAPTPAARGEQDQTANDEEHEHDKRRRDAPEGVGIGAAAHCVARSDGACTLCPVEVLLRNDGNCLLWFTVTDQTGTLLAGSPIEYLRGDGIHQASTASTLCNRGVVLQRYDLRYTLQVAVAAERPY